ncbi:MAG: glutathione S-transferase N-terminal domain-containing protein [Pseudomonadota bacterium]
MSKIVQFPTRWPPTMPDAIQLYSMNTPNGQKIGVCLEEMGLSYDAHLIHIGKNDQHDPEYLKLSPNGKIPTILDPQGPEGQPIVLMESIVILEYLADKTGMLFPKTYRDRMDAKQWLAFQAAHIGPMFGQFGHFFLFAKDKTTDTYAQERYTKEAKRLLGVLNTRLKERAYIMDDFSIVDIAMVPWVECLDLFYHASAHLDMPEYEHVQAWRKRVTTRPAYIVGKDVCKPG